MKSIKQAYNFVNRASSYKELRALTFLGTIHDGLQFRGCAI
jgi:hypothetical protein